MITPSTIVRHQLSGLLFRCLNNKQARWMNMNPFYVIETDQAEIAEFLKYEKKQFR